MTLMGAVPTESDPTYCGPGEAVAQAETRQGSRA
jgi:hypothetical protein